MSSRALWALSLPLAVLGWVGILFFTGAVPPAPLALVALVPLLTLAMMMTAAPLVWVIARRLRVPGLGEHPALALRVALWIGLGIAICVILRLVHSFSWAIALTLAVILGLLETFLQQLSRQRSE